MARVAVVQAKFSPGVFAITLGCREAFHRTHDSISALLLRHVSGDYGNLSPEDVQENEYSIAHGFRILSKYALSDGTEIYVITEADRSVTTFLLVSEY